MKKKNYKPSRAIQGIPTYAGKDIINKIARDINLPADISKTIVNQLFKEIIDILYRGEAVQFMNLGTFYMRETKRKAPLFLKNVKIGMIDMDRRSIPHFNMALRLRKKLMRESIERFKKESESKHAKY